MLKVLCRATGASYELTRSLDRPDRLVLLDGASPNSIVAIIDDMGTEPIIAIEPGVDRRTGLRRPPRPPTEFPRLVAGGVQAGLNVNPKTGKMVFARSHGPGARRGLHCRGPTARA